MNNQTRITIRLAAIWRAIHRAGAQARVVKVAFAPDAAAAIPVRVRAGKQ